MATVDEIARAALAAVGPADGLTSDPLVVAHGWVNDRYAELVSQVRFRHLRRFDQIVLPAAYRTGTVDVVAGSPDLVGTDTVFTPAMVGRFLLLTASTVWYRIARVDDATHLTLETPVIETTATDLGFTIAQRYLALPAETRFIATAGIARTRASLQVISQRELDEMRAPGRTFIGGFGVGDPAGVIADAGYDEESGERLFEIYPYSLRDEVVSFAWYRTPRRYEPDEPLPPTIDLHILKEGVLVDIYRYFATEAARKGRFDVAGYFSNAEARQGTRWADKMRLAVRADRGLDDTQFLWRAAAGPFPPSDIRNAHDEVWSRY